MAKPKLWTRNYTTIIISTILGAVGSVLISFALGFLVFDETKSTLASGLVIAVSLIPSSVIPLVVSPLMDRLPRKPFLVWGDGLNGLIYLLAGFYLMRFQFTYTGYLIFSLIVGIIGAMDSLAYTSLYPNLIPEGCTQKGYAVSQMVYPTITVLVTPLAGWLYERVGIAPLCIAQGALSICAALLESTIRIKEQINRAAAGFSPQLWLTDLKDAFAFLKKEKGLRSIYTYMAIVNGIDSGYSPVLIAFFSTAPGFSAVMYAGFSIAEFLGRTIGGMVHYHLPIKPEKRFSFAFLVYLTYEVMDMILLWIGYPFMLANRALCGFLGVNSAALREASVQKYIPDAMRAKINAFASVIYTISCGVLSLIIGALVEIFEYRLLITLCGFAALCTCLLTIGRNRREISQIYSRS